MMRTIITNILSKLGYKELVMSHNGEDAYKKLTAKKFDLAIVDWMMPELDGIGLLKKVRSDEKLKSLPILMLTAKSETDEVKEALVAGANDYIVKPFTAKVLEEKIDAIFKNTLTAEQVADKPEAS